MVKYVLYGYGPDNEEVIFGEWPERFKAEFRLVAEQETHTIGGSCEWVFEVIEETDDE